MSTNTLDTADTVALTHLAATESLDRIDLCMERLNRMEFTLEVIRACIQADQARAAAATTAPIPTRSWSRWNRYTLTLTAMVGVNVAYSLFTSITGWPHM